MSIISLTLATVLIAVLSEMLVDQIQGAQKALGCLPYSSV